MAGLLDYIRTKSQREKVAFVCSGIAAVATAAWAVFSHFSASEPARAQNSVTVNPTISPQMNQTVIVPPSTPSASASTAFKVCQGEHESGCPVGTKHIPCGVDASTWVAQYCATFKLTFNSRLGGNFCGYTVFEVKCEATK
jgi:hypothetical protein